MKEMKKVKSLLNKLCGGNCDRLFEDVTHYYDLSVEGDIVVLVEQLFDQMRVQGWDLDAYTHFVVKLGQYMAENGNQSEYLRSTQFIPIFI